MSEKVKRVTLKVAEEGKLEHAWEEAYVEGAEVNGFEPGEDPEAFARALIAFFNGSLRPGEKRRVLVSTVVDEIDKPKPAEPEPDEDEDEGEDDSTADYLDSED